jgi:hypothetical protein
MTELALAGEAREVVLAEVQAVRAHAHDDDMKERLAEVAAAVDDGELADDSAELLESVLELGLQTGRIRAYYGPGGEQAALTTLRKLPRGRLRGESAAEVTRALAALGGATLDSVRIAAAAPGAFILSIQAGGVEASVRLDSTGVRLTSLGT